MTANIEWPDMFGSEVCVFFNEDAFRMHLQREGALQGRMPLPPERSLAGEMGLVLPDGFAELRPTGHAKLDIIEGEVWFLGELPDLGR